MADLTERGRETPTCRRCQQLGAHCEGYGIRLHWLPWCPHTPNDQQDPDAPTGTRRSLTHLGVSGTAPPLSSAQIDLALRQIDEWCPDSGFPARESGLFSVFQSESFPISSVQDGERDLIFAHTRTQHEKAADSSPENLLATETAEEEEEELAAIPIAQALLRLGGDFSLNTCKAACGQSGGIVAVEDEALQTKALRVEQQNRPSPGPPRYLNELNMPSKQKRLIHHWVTFTSRKIALIDDAYNPCRTMMLPMAWQGLVSKAGDANANIAIFHALCASAAYNLYELGGRTVEQDRILGLDHEQQAVQHLRHDLTEAEQHRDQSFAMAIMACIAVEAVSGTTQRWRTHVSGGLGYLAQWQAKGVDETVLSAFRKHMVKMAILSGFSVPSELKSFLANDVDDALEFEFPYYGVSRSFLQALDRMNMLAAGTEPILDEDLGVLELQLYLGHPSATPPKNAPGTLAPNPHDVVYHTSMAFYYARLVFFQRRIRQTPAAGVQDLVDLGVQELEAVERLGRGELGCMMLWPALVLGAECSGPQMQKRMKSVSDFECLFLVYLPRLLQDNTGSGDNLAPVSPEIPKAPLSVLSTVIAD